MGTLQFLLSFAVNLKLFIKQKYNTVFNAFFTPVCFLKEYKLSFEDRKTAWKIYHKNKKK